MSDERSVVVDEIRELGKQDSRNLRTSLIFLGLILSSITFLYSQNPEIVQNLRDNRFVLLSISLLFASTSAPLITSTLRWLEEGLFYKEIDTETLRKKARNLMMLVFISRLSLSASIFLLFLGLLNESWLNLGQTVVIVTPTLLLALLGWKINRKNIWSDRE